MTQDRTSGQTAEPDGSCVRWVRKRGSTQEGRLVPFGSADQCWWSLFRSTFVVLAWTTNSAQASTRGNINPIFQCFICISVLVEEMVFKYSVCVCVCACVCVCVCVCVCESSSRCMGSESVLGVACTLRPFQKILKLESEQTAMLRHCQFCSASTGWSGSKILLTWKAPLEYCVVVMLFHQRHRETIKIPQDS